MSEIITVKHTEIRLANYDEIPAIIDFIKTEWNENHIYVKCTEFFKYEHCVDGRVNAIIAVNQLTSCIEGILLFYQTRRDLSGADLYGGIWCVSKKCTMPLLGYKMVGSVKTITKTRGHSGVGINPETTAKIFSHIQEQYVGKMNHYYRLANKDSYQVAVINNKKISSLCEYHGCRLLLFDSADYLFKAFLLPEYEKVYPYKDEWYIEKRYFNHPIYQYLVYGIEMNEKMEGILVARVVIHNGIKILRLVDFIGNLKSISYIGMEIQRLMEKENYEYVDFYEYGIDDWIMKSAGFMLNEKEDENIIPNYFEPFVCKNIELWFHSPYKKYTVFKADADQDRPNEINISTKEE